MPPSFDEFAGVSKLIALRCGVEVTSLPPFLAAQLSPEFRPGSDEDFATLVADIYGVGLKPVLGPEPAYLKSVPEGLVGWSRGVAVVAEFLVSNSKSGLYADPWFRPMRSRRQPDCLKTTLPTPSLSLKTPVS